MDTWFWSAMILVALGACLVTRLNVTLWDRAGTSPTRIDGVNVFALFYVLSQALERLLEPIAALGCVKKAARRATRAIIFWALATLIALLVSAWARLYLLQLVGMQGAPRLMEISVSALVIGGGTKPLHDLITKIDKANKKT